jgi:hypothetical protein
LIVTTESLTSDKLVFEQAALCGAAAPPVHLVTAESILAKIAEPGTDGCLRIPGNRFDFSKRPPLAVTHGAKDTPGLPGKAYLVVLRLIRFAVKAHRRIVYVK